MSPLFQSILVSIISVLFTKWVDSIWPSKELSKDYLHQTLHVRSEVNLAISTKKTLSEQINDRIFLSNGAYYFITMLMLYALLSLAYMFLYTSETYFNHPLQQSVLADFIREYGKNRNDLLSIVVAFLLYPLINFIARGPFKLIIAFLKSMSFTFTEANVQQIRMGTCVSLSILLALGIAYYVF